MIKIILGNILSLAAAIFLTLACISKKEEKIYMFQLFECIFLLISQIVFWQWGAAVVLSFSVFRNLLLWKGKYSFTFFISIFFAALFFGVFFNTGGAVGLIPVVANTIYNASTYYAKTYFSIKLSLLFNIAFWIIYACLIFDFVTAAVNAVSFIFNIATVFERRKQNLNP